VKETKSKKEIKTASSTGTDTRTLINNPYAMLEVEEV
jgi:hypothetical protein